MMMNAQKKDPQLVAQIQDMIESGMEPQKIADTLLEQAQRVQEGLPATKEEEQEFFPDEIIIASQALAYRDATTEDEEVIVRIINAAYAPEVSGQEAFRVGPGTVTRGEVQALLACPAHQWLLLELPRGRNIETDGTVLGVCCYTTDGEVEGKLGSIRYFAVTPRYHGVLIGHRFLQKLEELMSRAGCCRAMACIPDARLRLVHWLIDRGYTDVGSAPYPQEAAGHALLSSRGDSGARGATTRLVLLTKQLQTLPLPPKAREQQAESCTRADGTATFLGQEEHSTDDLMGEEQMEGGAPPPAVENSHLPPHWRGVQSMGRATQQPAGPAAASS